MKPFRLTTEMETSLQDAEFLETFQISSIYAWREFWLKGQSILNPFELSTEMKMDKDTSLRRFWRHSNSTAAIEMI